MTTNIKYYTKRICFQEIPDEISFTYFLTGCPNRCPNCHSPHLREDNGTPVRESLISDLYNNRGRASCILFMGGDDPDHCEDLIEMLHLCRLVGFKTALYSGNELDFITHNDELLSMLDYFKVGPYVEELGGLKSKTTNQRLYRLVDGKIKEDITHMFWRRLDED